MRSGIHIKGGFLWKISAIVLLGVIIASCWTEILTGPDINGNPQYKQPYTAMVKDTIPIKLTVEYGSPYNPKYNMVVAVLLPIGWNGPKNLTMSYTSVIGNGSFSLIPDNVTEPSSKGLYNWPTSLMKQFGVVNNFINDMQWVVFEADKGFSNLPSSLTVTVNMRLAVGEDGRNTNAVLAYLVADAQDGLAPVNPSYITAGAPSPYMYYELFSAPPDSASLSTSNGRKGCLVVSGGQGGVEDFCDPQLTTVDPFKAQTDDFITVSFDGYVEQTLLFNAPSVYLNATATDKNGNTYTVSKPTPKSQMKSVATNKYQLTLWPREYFGVPKTDSLTNMAYTITDASGNIVVGAGGTTDPNGYIFRCQ